MENSKENIAKAIIEVMKSVDVVTKKADVGSGRNSYKGVRDLDVKNVYKKAMQENGLSIIPIGIKPKVTIANWSQDYQGVPQRKQQVFTEVEMKYSLLHTSGESIEIVGYGHGIDSQDKSAGKATTYAMKYAILYIFMAPVGNIDDADKHPSEKIPIPAMDPKILKLVKGAKTTKDLLEVYNANRSAITKDVRLLSEFGSAKKRIQGE